MAELHQISGCENAARLADVIFVHGLGGHHFETWRHGKDASTSWPHWLGEEFPNVGVWSLGYAASPSKWPRVLPLIGRGSRDSGYSMPLPTRAVGVLDRLVQKELGTRPILWICHSLGGLLAKQVLRAANDVPDASRNRIMEQTRAVLFLATPHCGAGLASLADALRALFLPTPSIRDLGIDNSYLLNLYDQGGHVKVGRRRRTRSRWR